MDVFARPGWVLILLCCIFSCGAFAAAALEGEPADAVPRALAFDIPEQPLTAALQAYARASGQSVFFDGELAAGLRSAPLQGEFAPRDALRRLLAGTGLSARYTSATTFTLVGSDTAAKPDAPTPAAQEGAPKQAQDEGDARVVQQALERTLCQSPQARPGSYRAVVRLWVGATGHVRRAQLLASTGLARRDAAIEQAMDSLVLEAPPPDEADRPLIVLLLPKTSGSRDICAAVPAATD